MCLAHAGVLFSFSAGQRSQNLTAVSGSKTPSSVILGSVSLFSANTVATKAVSTNELLPAIAKKPENFASREKLETPDSSYGLRLKNLDTFLDADAVDQTARPDENFEIALGQRLPLRVEPMVLEFWIDKEGITVRVQCLEGACNDAADTFLTKLAELRFAPAVKDGAPVASRKVMQIDPLPTFGL